MKINMLIVDDESDVYLLFEQNFEKEIESGQVKLIYADSAEKALELLKSGHLQTDLMLILSDINMPGIRGLDLLKIIKKNYPSITIFMITAYGDSEETLQAWKYGAAEIITKPIDFSYLKNLIKDLIQLHQSKGKGIAHD